MSDLEVFSPPSVKFTIEHSAHGWLRAAAFDCASQILGVLCRRQDSARCVLCAVGDRVELHITLTHEVVMSQQCSGPDEAAAVSNAWWLALVNRGWVEDDPGITVKPRSDRRPSGK